jgi:hypothetical protein
MRYYGAGGIDLYAWKINCDPSVAGQSDDPSSWLPEQKTYYLNCKGNAAVYRVSFMQAVFFLTMMLGTLCSRGFHAGMYLFKSVMWVVLMGTALFLPNWLFDDTGYAWVSRVASVLFLIVQILVLVEFAYTLNEDW